MNNAQLICLLIISILLIFMSGFLLYALIFTEIEKRYKRKHRDEYVEYIKKHFKEKDRSE